MGKKGWRIPTLLFLAAHDQMQLFSVSYSFCLPGPLRIEVIPERSGSKAIPKHDQSEQSYQSNGRRVGRPSWMLSSVRRPTGPGGGGG